MHEKYITFKRGRIQGVCIPEIEPHLEFFSGAFENWMAEQPTTVFIGKPNRVVGVVLPPLGRSVVVKRFGSRSPLHRILSPLSASKAVRSFRVAADLHEAGAATPRPLIAWERRVMGMVVENYCITDEIRNAVTLRQRLKSPDGFETEKTMLLSELARLVRKTHDAGVLHRDLTIGNFLVAPKPVEGNRIFLIDLSRAVRFGRIPLPLRLMDLARMKLQDLWPDFFEAYCAGRPDWKAYGPLMNFFIRMRRWKMDFWKKINRG